MPNICQALNKCGCLVTKQCPTFATPCTVDHQAPLVHGISQARILEWVVISFSGGSSQPGDRTHISCTVNKFFTTEPAGKPEYMLASNNIADIWFMLSK